MNENEPRQETVGIFGGSFNPPHVAHGLACLYALSVAPLDRILVIPSYQHPLDKALLDYGHRLAMTKLAFRHLEPWVEVSRIEEELGGVSYTVDTLSELRRRNPDARLRLIVGSDILGEVERWRRFQEIAELAPLLIVPRMTDGMNGQAQAAARFYLPAVSSTDVRRALAAGEDPGEALPLAVRDYIREHGLYGS